MKGLVRLDRFARLALLLAAALGARAASAHFLWARLDPAHGVLRLEFAEAPGESAIPRLAGKGSEVSVLARPGRTVATRWEHGDLVADVPGTSAGAELDYGRYQIPGQGEPFMLRYSAKGARSFADSARAVGLRVELSAALVAATTVRVHVAFQGRPAAGAEVSAFSGGGELASAKTDRRGDATLKLALGGSLALRALVEAPLASGPCSVERNYGTLTIEDVPTSGLPAGADPAAYALLRRAFYAREGMPANVSSIEGKLQFFVGAKSYAGSFVYTRGEGATVAFARRDTPDADEAKEQVDSIFSHREGGKFEAGDGRYPITFVGGSDPRGRMVALNDPSHSTYRVQGDALTEVDRAMGPGARFVITVMAEQRLADGKTLPNDFAVSYFDGPKGALSRAMYFTDAYAEHDGVWLPTTRKIVIAAGGKLTSEELRFTGFVVRRSAR